MARKSGVKQVIFDIWQDHLEWSPKEIRPAVHEKLGGKRSKNNTYPGLRTVQQYIAEFRANLGQLVDEDKPWSIAASVRYELSPEATKDLFDIWRASLAMDRPISIRQAKWIVHIRNLFYQDLSTGNTYSDKVNRNLWLIRRSWLYSILERSSRIMGEQNLDTTNLDAASFMPNWERATALKLGKISHLSFPQEPLKKIEESGTSLTSPAVSIKSVEQAVWHNVRAEPPQHMEMYDTGFFDEVLPEEDLICAYWLTYLSKGPLWNDLPETPEVREYYESRRHARESGAFVHDSGGFPDDSMYSRQLHVRHKLLDWVKAHHSMSIRDYYTLGRTPHASLVLSPKLLSMVGYEVSPEDIESYAKLHEEELKAAHKGWSLIPAEVKQRLIHDEQTDDDFEILSDADNQVALEYKQREQEFLELVQQKGGVPKDFQIAQTFWESIRAEWIKRYPSDTKNKLWDLYPEPKDFENEYKRIIEKQKGGTK